MRRLPSLALLALACAPRPGAVPGHEPPSGDAGWVSALHRDHPLVGRVYDVRGARWVEGAAVVDAARRADFALLGETHDNPDHHLLQAWILRAMISAGRRPAIAFEMLDAGQQPALDAALSKERPAAGDVAPIWAAGGWPGFEWYRPIFDAAAGARLPIVAVNLPTEQVKEIVRKGRDAVPAALRARLSRDEPVPEAVLASLRKEMAEEHCGALPDFLLDPMVLAQRARDAQMAERLEAASADRGAVLVTGSGHARADRGVPAHLARDLPARKVVAIAFLEVSAGKLDPAAYAAEYGTATLPFDWAVFTPGVDRGDPCEGLREHARERGSR